MKLRVVGWAVLTRLQPDYKLQLGGGYVMKILRTLGKIVLALALIILISYIATFVYAIILMARHG